MNRDELIQEFLSKNDLGNRLLVPVENDASFRRYFRIKDKGLIVMDAPSELGESIESYVLPSVAKIVNEVIQNNSSIKF